jgi:transcriptional regulator
MSYPPPFTRPAASEWRERILAATPFALCIAAHQGALHTVHLPICISPDGVIRGHLQRNNPLAALPEGHRIRIVALGPHGYVSPLAYVNEAGQVPTWNYAAVHLEGPVQWIDQPDEVFALVAAQVRHSEGEAGWKLEDTSHYRAMLRAVRGFCIEPDWSDTSVKMSQNKRPEDAAAVEAEFRRQGLSDLAGLMARARAGS